MRNWVFSVLLLLFCSYSLSAFEVASVKTGMSVEEVRKRYPAMKKTSPDSEDDFEFFVVEGSRSARVSLGFCSDRLIHFSDSPAGDTKTFIRMIERETNTRGNADRYFARELNSPSGTTYMLMFEWNTGGGDTYSLSLQQLETSERAFISRARNSPNPCIE